MDCWFFVYLIMFGFLFIFVVEVDCGVFLVGYVLVCNVGYYCCLKEDYICCKDGIVCMGKVCLGWRLVVVL